ncbi:MAG: MATE family efflux transporter [Gammaproteobacteria bacterium]
MSPAGPPETLLPDDQGPNPLPAARRDAAGRLHFDAAAFAALAWPLILNNSLQALLNLTDTWFISRISPTATAGVGVVHWLILAVTLLVGGVAMCVQTFVAQEYGGGHYRRAGQSAWAGVWASLATAPLFLALALSSPWLLAPFGLPTPVTDVAHEYWFPRMLGEPLGLALWALLGFLNGIGRTRTSLVAGVVVLSANAGLNPLFMFTFGLGVAGAAWATNLAQLIGLGTVLALLLTPAYRRRYAFHLTWRPRLAGLRRHFTLGLPMGLVASADLLGGALFQLLITKTGTVGGAATQVVFMLTSLCYLPGLGFASAGTTLVGQAIGAGNKDWAARLGNLTILISAGYMGTMGLLLAALGPWLMPLFVNTTAPEGAAVVALGVQVLWLSALYQFFDGLNFGSSFCLRGAGDVKVPALLVAVLGWGFWIPATHILTFGPGEGLVDFLPALGLGAAGGWLAIVTYVMLLGISMFWRWRSGAWRRIKL